MRGREKKRLTFSERYATIKRVQTHNGFLPICKSINRYINESSIGGSLYKKFSKEGSKMKLAKKVLACVVAIALVSTLAISAFAADPALTISAPEKAAAGDTIEVTVGFNGIKGLENAGLALTYDAAALEFVSAQRDASTINASLFEAGNADGSVNIGIAFSGACTDTDMTLATITFKVLASDGSTELTFGVMDNDIAGVADPGSASATIQIGEEESEVPTEPTTTDDTVEPSDTDKEPSTEPEKEIPKTGDAGIAVAAGLVVLAGAAFVASKKRK